MIVLEKIISGGQTGVDQAGLRAARTLGLATGGHAPRGWKTEDGPAPWLADYGLVESTWDYAGRTAANVRDGDATLIIAANLLSPGEIRTQKEIERWKKPHTIVEVSLLACVDCIVEFLASFNVRVLNVAGNRESTSPGIGKLAEQFLVAALRPHVSR